MAWVAAIVSAYSGYQSAKEQEKQAKEAAKGSSQTTTKTPYMNEYLSAIAPWIMAEQQRIYSDRLQKYGASSSTSFNPIQALLANITPGYSGVGGGDGSGYNPNFGNEEGGQYPTSGYSTDHDANSISYNPFSPNYGVDPLSPEERQQMIANRASWGMRGGSSGPGGVNGGIRRGNEGFMGSYGAY